jgi:hypothetical protein
MLIFNHVRLFGLFTERIHHTAHGLHLSKKGKDWIVNNLVKEIGNLYLPLGTSLHIVLPWKEVNENILQLTQFNKGCVTEAPFVTSNNNMGCQRFNRNTDCQNTGVIVEFVNEVPLVTVDNNMECLSLRKSDDCHKLVNSIVSVNLPLKTDVDCVGDISKVNDDSQGVDYVSKPTRVNDVSQKR